ncbi:MAG: hypothetical protein K2H73_04610 [Treponemataceae bacterium]|nr:hypothetical protein [Treponemataceae bacterium]
MKKYTPCLKKVRRIFTKNTPYFFAAEPFYLAAANAATCDVWKQRNRHPDERAASESRIPADCRENLSGALRGRGNCLYTGTMSPAEGVAEAPQGLERGGGFPPP